MSSWLLARRAFFGSIALVEAGGVARPVGESAILGSFAVTASTGVFARLWSTLVRISRDA
jgi:hypothetical protein